MGLFGRRKVAPPQAPLTAEQVLSTALGPTTFREGYVREDVDAFLDRVVQTLRGTATVPLTAEDVDRARFRSTKRRDGYSTDDVDDLLDAIAQTLRG